jgi:Ca-activated chloride channel family protein
VSGDHFEEHASAEGPLNMGFGSAPFLYLYLGLVGLFLLLFFWQKKRGKALEIFAQRDLLPHIVSFSGLKRQRLRVLLISLSLLLGILALAQPQMGFYWEEERRRGLNILIAIDTSKSMLAEDVKPNRLEVAKEAAKDLVRTLRGDRVGLIAFSGEAFLVCPLTVEYTVLMQSLGELSVETLPKGGTSISSPIQEALKSYGRDPGDKILLLLSDGENLEDDPVSVTKVAERQGIRIFSVGVGAKEGGPIPTLDKENQKGFLKDDQGNVVRSRLNEEVLGKIASLTGGSYVRLDGGKLVGRSIHNKLSNLEGGEFEGPLKKRKKEWFQIPLGLSLFFLLLEPFVDKRRRGPLSGFALLLPIAFLFGCGGDALQDPHRLLALGKYDEAQKLYEALLAKTPDSEIDNYNLGTLLYKKGDYAKAVGHFVKVLLTENQDLEEKANYNLGNSKYRLAEQVETKDLQKAFDLYQDALDCYQRAIDLDGKDEDARVNRERAERKLSQLDDSLKKQKRKDREGKASKEKEHPSAIFFPSPSGPGREEPGSREMDGVNTGKDPKEAQPQIAAKPAGRDRVEMTREEAEALLEMHRSAEQFFVLPKLKSWREASPRAKRDW